MLDIHNLEIKAGGNGYIMVHLSSIYNAFDNGKMGLKLYPGTRSYIRARPRQQVSTQDFKDLNFEYRYSNLVNFCYIQGVSNEM